QTAVYTLLAEPGQQLGCLRADPDDVDTTATAVQGWLGGGLLDFLWFQRPWDSAGALEFAGANVPRLLRLEGLACFPHEGRLRRLPASEVSAWARAAEEIRSLRDQCAACARLEDAAGAVLGAGGAEGVSPALELMPLLRKLREVQPKTLCVLGS